MPLPGLTNHNAAAGIKVMVWMAFQKWPRPRIDRTAVRLYGLGIETAILIVNF